MNQPSPTLIVMTGEQMDEFVDRIVAGVKATQARPLSLKEAAQALGVCSESIRQRVKAGLIKQVPNIGAIRIPRAEIDRLLEGGF